MTDQALPQRLGKYEIKRVLGQGAMGVVYEGFDPAIERIVAIKTIKTNLLDSSEREQVVARFKREAQAAGRMTHPNIITIYDYGEDNDTAYIAMEFVKGKELKDLFDADARFTNEQILTVMRPFLGALAYAHDNGIVHRDLKPANILLVGGELERVKIMDFGIARVESSTMTQVGTIMGTPSYMSPEQFMGQPVDKRSDLFSVGVILYQMLTGDKPFTGNVTAIMHKVLRENPVLPSELNMQVPKAMDAVVRKALSKVPDERFQSAKEFLAAIEAGFRGGSAADIDATVALGGDATMVMGEHTVVSAGGRAPAAAAVARKGPPIAALIGGGAALVVVLGIGGWFLTRGGTAPAPEAIVSAPVSPPMSTTMSTPGASAPASQIAPPAMPKVVGYVDVVTTPDGVSIRFPDGTLLGTSPTKLMLAPGEYELVLQKEGFYDLETSIEVQANDQIPFEVELTPKS